MCYLASFYRKYYILHWFHYNNPHLNTSMSAKMGKTKSEVVYMSLYVYYILATILFILPYNSAAA